LDANDNSTLLRKRVVLQIKNWPIDKLFDGIIYVFSLQDDSAQLGLREMGLACVVMRWWGELPLFSTVMALRPLFTPVSPSSSPYPIRLSKLLNNTQPLSPEAIRTLVYNDCSNPCWNVSTVCID